MTAKWTEGSIYGRMRKALEGYLAEHDRRFKGATETLCFCPLCNAARAVLRFPEEDKRQLSLHLK